VVTGKRGAGDTVGVARQAALVDRIDGTQPPSPTLIETVSAICDRVEDGSGTGCVVLHVSGALRGRWADNLTVGLMSKWEQCLRRLERLPAMTVAVATGDCGGPALDVLLATDYRIAGTDMRLEIPMHAGATWPGMALYRLSRHASGAAAIREAVLFGTAVDARDAVGLHLVHHVTDDPAAELAAVQERAAALSGSELRIRRQLMFDASTTSFEDALGAHLAACDRALRRTSEVPS
jgi:isomerase DpgB